MDAALHADQQPALSGLSLLSQPGGGGGGGGSLMNYKYIDDFFHSPLTPFADARHGSVHGRRNDGHFSHGSLHPLYGPAMTGEEGGGQDSRCQLTTAAMLSTDRI